MSWDNTLYLFTVYHCVTPALFIYLDVHHLAVEDLLHVPQRTKVDIYPKQTYISCTLLTLLEQLGDGESRQVDPYTSPHGINPDFLSQRLPLTQLDSYKPYHYVEEQNYEDLHVEMEQVTLLLLEGGTLITLFQVSGQSVVAPIVERLSHDYSLTRKHGDASFLLQSVIDGIVDHAIPIADAFRHEINNLASRVLTLPKMMFTRDLHRVTSQLSMLKRTLVPTQMLVHSLRGKDERSPLSPLARTYMRDVMDHCNTMVEDIDSMLSLCEKLINMVRSTSLPLVLFHCQPPLSTAVLTWSVVSIK
jgi:Mg2+ and Co2+ transporter CorA